MVDYEIVNKAINEVFFDGRFRDLPVYLDLEEEIATEVASYLSCPTEKVEEHLGKCVAQTLNLHSEEKNIYLYHYNQSSLWRENRKFKSSPPPFTALLLAFSLAAERMRGEGDISPHNYYLRLCEVLGLPVSYKDTLSQARNYTKVLWLHLNLWLIETNYDFGKPTAAQVTNWTYVSYAISQSLIRDSERESFKKLFKRFSLSPYDGLGDSEMMLCLHEWMPSHEPTMWLKKLWGNDDLRERISQSALQELEEWEDAGSANLDVSKNLFWVLAIDKFPRRRLGLFLSTTGSYEIQDSKIELRNNYQSIAAKAFGDCERLSFNRLTGTEFFNVEPIGKISIDALLLSTFELTNTKSDAKYSYSAAPIITFLKLETSRVYKQVSYVTLFSEHKVLCHEKWKDSVIELFNDTAREGFCEYTSDSFPGVPKGWVLIDQVQLLRKPTYEIHKNLQCLVPLLDTATISLQEGLKLASGIWHSHAPPHVYASDDDGLLNVDLNMAGAKSKGKPMLQTFEDNFDPDFLDDESVDIDLQNYTLSARRGNKQVASKAISFRSANSPKSLRLGKDIQVVNVIEKVSEQKYLPYAADITEIQEDEVYIRGMEIIGDLEPPELAEIELDNGRLPSFYEEENIWGEYLSGSTEGLEESCIVRGYHVWVDHSEPTTFSASKDKVKWQCCDCNLVVFTSRKKKKRKSKKAAERIIFSNEQIVSHIERNKHIEGKVIEGDARDISPDIIFDAVSYLGTGTIRKLDGVISTIDMQPWEVSEVRRGLVDLGHIDIAHESSSEYYGRWTCCPPALIVCSDENRAFLSGFRNEGLIEKIYENASILDVEVEKIPQLKAPSSYMFHGEFEDLVTIIDGVVDPYGRELSIVESPSAAMIMSMPNMANYQSFLSPVHIEADNKDLERFNPQTGKWEKGELNGVGAYRTYLHGRCYFYHNENAESYKGDYNLVKLLAARNDGLRLHRYNKQTSDFQCLLGCEPPSFMKRALVACSGLLPVKEEQFLSYRNVPIDIASRTLYKMYS
jgi:hypothetical protein